MPIPGWQTLLFVSSWFKGKFQLMNQALVHTSEKSTLRMNMLLSMLLRAWVASTAPFFTPLSKANHALKMDHAEEEALPSQCPERKGLCIRKQCKLAPTLWQFGFPGTRVSHWQSWKLYVCLLLMDHFRRFMQGVIISNFIIKTPSLLENLAISCSVHVSNPQSQREKSKGVYCVHICACICDCVLRMLENGKTWLA